MISSSNEKPIRARGAEALASISGSALSSANNMPMLSSISERLSILLPLTARQGALPALSVEEHGVQTVRYNEAVASLPNYCVTAVASVAEMRSSIFIAVDGMLTKRVVHYMLGGRADTATTEKKPFTTIERSIARSVLDRMLIAVGEAFASVLKITPKIESIDVQPRFATVMSSVTPVTIMRQRVICDDIEGEVIVIIPRAALDPIRERLSTLSVSVEVNESEEHWMEGLRESASETPMVVKAVIGTLEVPLSTVLRWGKGTKIVLPPIGQNTTQIVSNDKTLARGRVGTFNGRMGVLVNEIQEKGKKGILAEIGGKVE